LKEEDLLKQIKIRNENHSVIETLHRQALHDAYLKEQIAFPAKHIKPNNWKTLSIPKGASGEFNAKKFSK